VQDGSLEILVEWLENGENYSRWRGDASGKTRKALCSEIQSIMKAKGKENFHCNLNHLVHYAFG